MKAEGARPTPQRSGREAMRGRKHSSIIVNRSSLAKARLLVVGDVMLDRYWFGDVARISPEAPVPVVRIDRIEERPGGAANVARNAAAFGTAVSLLSVIGADEAGTRLKRLLGKERIAVELHRDRSVATTIKLRVIGRRQQLLRVDFEKTPSHEVLASKLKDFGRMLRSADAVILSDYGKGGLAHISKMIGMARQAGKPVLVDPKGEDYSRYRGATMITPNRAEFRQVVGGWTSESELTRKAQQLRRRLGLAALLITRSEEGMTLYQAGQRLHVAAQAREVYDVSGAGDTVIATLGTMLAGGAGIEDAVRVANRAAGIVVGKFGTAVVYPEELFGKDEGERSVST
jgi:rfaE bifunctional protein kinase chain/domain